MKPSFPIDRDALTDGLRDHLGISIATTELALEWRDYRWMAVLESHVALVADSTDGWARLRQEAALLEAARAVVGPAIPRVLVEDPALRLQVRESMSGLHGYEIEARIFGIPGPFDEPTLAPGLRYAEDCPLTPWGETFARDLGRTLARFHRAMSADEGRAIGLRSSPTDWDAIERIVGEHPDLRHLAAPARRVRAWDEARPPGGLVLHGDPHFFNMFATDDGHLCGLVDVGDACVGDRHEDLRYLHSEGPRFARIAMHAYEAEAGTPVDPRTAARFQVRSAFGHFPWIAPDAPRFPRIVQWATEALRALTPEWAEP